MSVSVGWGGDILNWELQVDAAQKDNWRVDWMFCIWVCYLLIIFILVSFSVLSTYFVFLYIYSYQSLVVLEQSNVRRLTLLLWKNRHFIFILKISFNLNTLQCPATCRGKDGHLVLGKVVPCVLCAPLVMTGNNCTLYLISCALESYQTVNGHTQPYFAFIWPWSAWPGRQHTNICQCLTSWVSQEPLAKKQNNNYYPTCRSKCCLSFVKCTC